ncbi:LacI family transcriptional regulator [Enterococcus sp. PF1-24]|uniref:LacI family DNA-binding transcriptional regulator n=1 Tax=unclassified Enterococcus TaxID=2608891 RepID=UPI0024757CD2|nr:MULTISPECIES: LacI family DNA-binding transcriptional regulator [unclassified Enterococcus]MDH6363427.1 LacI family transcriptional regulator [Enterococcus sp. PFB1-1]MDH6400521.1 LacI family transcriptional regulator [Enterococcus sp. PF1-24]
MEKASLKDIARIANVSVATVSYALNNSSQVSEVTRAKIKKIANELNYIPNLSAQNLRTNNSNLICAIVNTYQGNFNGDVLQEIQDILERKGFQLLAFSGSIPDIVKTDIIDGVLMLNYRADSTELQQFTNTLNKPIVFMTNEINTANSASVVIDNRLGIKYLFDVLKKSKNERICFITGDDNSFNSEQRYNAAKEFYTKSFKKNDFSQHVYSGQYDPIVTYQLGKRFLENDQYDAFLCFNDDMALGIYHAASDLNIKVGKDISIVGFDDSYVSSVVSPGLTTVQVDKKEWAEEVVNQYLELKASKSTNKVVKLSPKLILRGSVNQ